MSEQTYDRGSKHYTFQEYPETQEVRISVVDDEGYPCYEQVVLPLAVWDAMAYTYVVREQKPRLFSSNREEWP